MFSSEIEAGWMLVRWTVHTISLNSKSQYTPPCFFGFLQQTSERWIAIPATIEFEASNLGSSNLGVSLSACVRAQVHTVLLIPCVSKAQYLYFSCQIKSTFHPPLDPCSSKFSLSAPFLRILPLPNFLFAIKIESVKYALGVIKDPKTYLSPKPTANPTFIQGLSQNGPTILNSSFLRYTRIQLPSYYCGSY